MKVRGIIPDFEKREFFFGELTVKNQHIESIERLSGYEGTVDAEYILPGLIDAHVHIESSMLSPSNFAEAILKYGTVAVVSDPHEIANVLGKEGIDFMVNDAKKVPLKIHFTAPSCVPATNLEQSGAILNSKDLNDLARNYEFVALGEMMNFPGVIGRDGEVIKKINSFKKLGLSIDGHAPGLVGEDLQKYIDAGISTDHEAVDLIEGREKIERGMKILIREGSAAKNFEKLWPLINEFPDEVMLCCDDIHPDELLSHHLDWLIVRGLEKGLDIFDLLKAASLNPINHYGLDVGRLRKGDKADFIVVENLKKFIIRESYINGKCVYRVGETKALKHSVATPNNFARTYVSEDIFEMKGKTARYRVIGVIDGDLYTTSEIHEIKEVDGMLKPEDEQDIVRVALVSRYNNKPPALGWIKNTGLKNGAIASSIAHDSHNIIVMGTEVADMARAVNKVVDNQGGIAISNNGATEILPLPVAGLMSDEPVGIVGERYSTLNTIAREMGCTLAAPFMTLSFMALLVIPELKIGDRGLFDVKEFKFVEPLISDD